MIYTFVFEVVTKGSKEEIDRYFTIVSDKISKGLVNKVILQFNAKNSFCDTDEYKVITVDRKNILLFSGSKASITLTIQRAEDGEKIKASSKYEYISLGSECRHGVNINNSHTGFSRLSFSYDMDFCKCLLERSLADENGVKTIVRYGAPFGDVFNSSYLGNRLQIRFSDCAVRIGNKVVE